MFCSGMTTLQACWEKRHPNMLDTGPVFHQTTSGCNKELETTAQTKRGQKTGQHGNTTYMSCVLDLQTLSLDFTLTAAYVNLQYSMD